MFPPLLTLLSIALLLQAPPAMDIPQARTVPRMDANGDDNAWAKAATISSLRLSRGKEAEGLQPSPTVIRLLWNEDYLFLRFICQDAKIESPYEGRDLPHYNGDVIEVFLDAIGDAHSYMELQVSPSNQIFDQMITLSAPPESKDGRLTDAFLMSHFATNPKWDMEGLRTAARLTKNGWVVDIALPAKAFGIPRWKPMAVRANLLRYDWLTSDDGKRSLVAMNWSAVQYGCPHISPEAMGTLNLTSSE